MFKLNFRTQVMIGFAVAIVLVFALGIFSYNSITQLERNQEEVDHSQQLVSTSRQTLQLLIDAETGTRGYVATGQNAFLDPYKSTVAKLGLNLSKLENLVENDPDQQDNINKLVTAANDKLVTMKNNIDTRDAKGLDYVIQSGMLLKGKEVMDQIRKLVADINDIEVRSLNIGKQKTQQAANQTILATEFGSAIFLVIIVVLFFYIQKTFEQQKKAEAEVKDANAELGVVLAENEAKNWLLTGVGQLNEKMQGQQNEKELSENVLSEVCKYTDALSGTLYLFNDNDEELELCSYYAFHDLSAVKPKIKLSEGWMGQVAQDQKAATIKGNLNDKLKLQTSIVDQELAEILIVPFFFDKKLKGVMEVAFQKEVSESSRDYILAAADDIGIAINTAQARTIMHDLFEETQQQAEELEAQQEEMRVTNEELLNKTEMLQASEEELRVQQEELRTINAELEEKASLLEEKNQAIEEARAAINLKVTELETTGKYKSEFLANMSHELRTPLNSILVLARILKDNKADNLNADQIKYASVIFNAGNDLLTLINDILDLSKIESGKLDMQYENIKVDSIVKDMELLFAEVAGNKNINFINNITGVPDTIFTDKVRVEQVIKNLLSNAFKFTPEAGSISLKVSPGKKEGTIAFAIKDSGIGIAPEKQRLIFEAFQQADGSTSRKYGGTGLGLSISRELASLLGGEISLTSAVGQGAEFTLTIPITGTPTANSEEEQHIPTVEDYKAKLPVSEPLKPAAQTQIRVAGRSTPLVVIVEDDQNFADILHDYARDHGYEALMLHEGGNAAEFIKDKMPDAVILDIMLPGKDGWQILKELKADGATKDIPVHLMSAGEAAANRVRKEGAISFMKKPINTETLDKLFNDMMSQSGVAFKQILLVEDHEAQSQALKDLMQKQGIAVDQAFTGEQAFNMLQQNDYQCVILDLNLPDESGLDLLDRVKAIDRFAELPVIVNTAMELDKTSVNRLMQYANAMVMKTNKSADRLIDEVNLFLHKVSSSPAAAEAPKASAPAKGKDSLKGKKVLIVDDDMRNIFALSSALQQYDLIVEIANDGDEALEKLETTVGVDIVLMDIMMPKMDGYEATRQIRKQNKWSKLPVIALTAKAMKEDREKCLAAGANDYITKPIDMDRLISLMQLWLEG